MPKKKDAVIIAAVLAVAVILLAVSRLMPKTDLAQKTADATLAPDAVEYLDATPAPTAEPTTLPANQPMEASAAPQATETPESALPQGPVGPMPPAASETVRGHVILTVNGRQYGDPIPMDRDKIITVRQEDGKINKVHITPETVGMESSTCENQDCVGQGIVDVNTYHSRILGTFVICLPNNVTIEMVPAE